MMKQIRADQIGSLRRPAAVLAARAAYRVGQLPLAALRAEEDKAVLAALDQQGAAGIEVFTDGELRRDAWQTDVSDALDGFVTEYPMAEQTLPDGSTVRLEMHSKAVRAKLTPRRRIAAHEAAFLNEQVPGRFKITLPSPNTVAWSGFQPGVTQAYASREELLADLSAIIGGELRALVEEGVAYLQLDEGFNRYVNGGWRAQVEGRGVDPEAALTADIAAENACYDALPRERVTLGSHLCRGSRTRAVGVGSYDWLAERLFGELHVDRFLLEYDTDAAGGFAPLRHLPKGRVVVLGLVTTKDGRLERRDDLLRRIEEAARYCPLDQLALSPQCGFAGSADNDFMSEEEQWRKLALVAAVAREVWGSEAVGNGQ